METELTRRAERDYLNLSPQLQRQVDKPFDYLRNDLHHPSLRAETHGGADDVWQERVNRDDPFYFQVVGDTYLILMIIPHPT